MGMIFDPCTPTLCKWVYKREAWCVLFTHTYCLWVCTQQSSRSQCDVCFSCKVEIMWTCKIVAAFELNLSSTQQSVSLFSSVLTVGVLKHPNSSTEKYRKSDLLTCNWASSICCYDSGWEGNQTPAPLRQPCNQHPTPLMLLLSLCIKGWGGCVTEDGATHGGSWTTPFPSLYLNVSIDPFWA